MVTVLASACVSTFLAAGLPSLSLGTGGGLLSLI